MAPVVMLGELAGALAADSRSILRLVGPRRSLFGLDDLHAPFALVSLFFETTPTEEAEPESLSFIPAAFYIHELDLAGALDHLISGLGRQLVTTLVSVANSPLGDQYQKLHDVDALQVQIRLSKDRSVLVLGSYSPRHVLELRDVQRELDRLGYRGLLISDLVDIPAQSVEEKVRMWATVSRFAVMVDRVPGGHVAEYGHLRAQRTVMGICLDGDPSTFMIGDDPLVDINYFKLFQIPAGESAVVRTSDVADWAEGFLASRASAYGSAYPWR